MADPFLPALSVIVGLAPTGRAKKELQASGIESLTLQKFLVSGIPNSQKNRLFIVDESSLASTSQFKQLLNVLKPGDRVLEVGDIRQHESIEAARIFHEQQLSGMKTFKLTELVRQQKPELRAVVDLLQNGKAGEAMRLLAQQDRVTIIEKRKPRLERIAADYAANPAGALVISPDNESRMELNGMIREKLQATGELGANAVTARILVGRQDGTKEDLKLAGTYETGQVVQFATNNKTLGVKAKDYGTVIDRNSETNTVKVERSDGKLISYNPARHQTQIYEAQQRELAAGDQITFRQSWKEKGITTGDRATLESVDAKGNVRAVLDDRGRVELFNVRQFRHFDYAYASTSYSAQGATAERVLVNMETSGRGAKALLTQAMAYVALSRPRQEMRVFTDDQVRLDRLLQNEEVKKMALHPRQIEGYNRVA